MRARFLKLNSISKPTNSERSQKKNLADKLRRFDFENYRKVSTRKPKPPRVDERKDWPGRDDEWFRAAKTFFEKHTLSNRLGIRGLAAALEKDRRKTFPIASMHRLPRTQNFLKSLLTNPALSSARFNALEG
jgi:hypothetical protein